MAAETITLQTLHDRVANLMANHTGVDTGLTTEIKWGLHVALRELVQRVKPSGFRKDGSLTLVTSTADYSLADDFGTLIDGSIKFSVTPFTTLIRLHEQEYDGWNLDASQATGEPRRYLQRGRSASTGLAQVRVWPTPTSTYNGKTVAYRYYAIPTVVYSASLASNLDPRVDPEYHQYLVYGALFYLQNYLRGMSDLQLYLAKWEQFLKLARADEPEVIGETFQRQPYMPGRFSDARTYPYPAGLTGP